MSSVVYFIENRAAGLLKIGVSRQIKRRLAALRNASGLELHLRGLIPGGADVEAELHARFEDYRVRLEWFRADPALLAAVDLLLAERGITQGDAEPDAPDAFTRKAMAWAVMLLGLESNSKAYGDVALKVGVKPGFIENLVRGRIKRIAMADFEALRITAIASYERQLSSLQSEVDAVQAILDSGTELDEARDRAARAISQLKGLHCSVSGDAE